MTNSSAQHCQLISYDVRIWRIVAYRGKTTTTYSFRWRVGGHRHSRTFITYRLADSFRAQLVTAAATGEAFDPDSGLPLSMRPVVARSWFEHAHDFAAIKWPGASPRHRKGTAEALASLTIALSTETVDTSTASQLRHALTRYAFNTTAQCDDPIPALATELRWVEAHSLALTVATEPAHLRRALHAISVKLDGAPAAPATLARKRATFHAALEYAVELGLLPANPLTRCRRTHRPASSVVDRRTVINPDQAQALIGAVNVTCAPLEAYFACLYYAGLRPGEARELRAGDCDLPAAGWGQLTLTGSRQAAGAAWTDTGHPDEHRPLKHRNRTDTRPVPAHPELVAILRRHLEHHDTGSDGHLFVARHGPGGTPLAPPYPQPVSMSTIYRAWHRARNLALTPAQAASTLARRPYDLRHACLSSWLNVGVPASQIATWAGHSTAVLLTVYAHCIDGQDEVAKQRIEAAIPTHTKQRCGNPRQPGTTTPSPSPLLN